MIRKTISMPDTMGDWISGRITQGQYNNESEYFRDLVRRDQREQERLDFLMRRMDEGERQLVAGQTTALGSDADIDTFFDSIDG